MNPTQALIPALASSKNGNSGVHLEKTSSAAAPNSSAAPPPLTDELVAQILHGRGLRGWLRLARVARVLGLFTLYLFLDTYDVRAEFNRRMAEHRFDDARSKGWLARTRAGWRNFIFLAGDKLIRLLRFVVFRGEEGSSNKSARLAKQARWLSRSLIELGPTFIKIGQALGTRADLLPLSYVKELSTLQDQVPAFPTAEAFARIESELGKPLSECYA